MLYSAMLCYAVLRCAMQADLLHYPERLGQLFIINSPGFFAGAFRIISAMLPPKAPTAQHSIA